MYTYFGKGFCYQCREYRINQLWETFKVEHPDFFTKDNYLRQKHFGKWRKIEKEGYDEKFKEVCVIMSVDCDEIVLCEYHLDIVLNELRKYKIDNIR